MERHGPFCCRSHVARFAESGYHGESRCSCVPLPDRQGAGSIASSARDIKRGRCARFGEFERRICEIDPRPSVESDTYPVRALEASTKERPRKSLYAPLRATKVGSLGRFYRQLRPFLPKLAPSSRHDELGARLARSILLPAAMWQDLLSLDALVNPDAPVFRSRTGKALDRSRVLRVVQEAAKRARVEGGVSPRWLRHAHATHSLERGAPIHLVQATLRLPAGICTRVRASRAPSSSWRDEGASLGKNGLSCR